jgi:uncharacterized protein
MSPRVTRRQFLESTALAPAAGAILVSSSGLAASPGTLPQRTLGRTGVQVPVLAFGCGSRFLMYEEEDTALRVLSGAIDAGITYLDTAVGYGNGKSEERLGRLMPSRRGDVFLATKISNAARARDAALREVEQSLTRLRTDRIDLLHIHSLLREDDLAAIEAADGVLKALYELRDQKVARFIGMTSHTDGAVMATAIERHDLDCVQMAMNPSRALQFEELALPAARRKNLGIICMKVTAQEQLVGDGPGKADMNRLVRYALSLPVATAVIGMPRPEFISENIALVRQFTPMSPEEAERLRQHVAPQRARVASFFSHHADV